MVIVLLICPAFDHAHRNNISDEMRVTNLPSESNLGILRLTGGYIASCTWGLVLLQMYGQTMCVINKYSQTCLQRLPRCSVDARRLVDTADGMRVVIYRFQLELLVAGLGSEVVALVI